MARKTLKDVSFEEYETLKNLELLYGLYPDATGSYFHDVVKHTPEYQEELADLHDQTLREDYFNT